MPSIFETEIQQEYQQVSTLDEEYAQRLNHVLEDKAKFDPAGAERDRKEAAELSMDLIVQHDRYLSAGLLYKRAIYWANEYQAIIISQQLAKAKMEWAIEWLKIAVDLALLVVTLGLTNLYRVVLPRIVARNFVVRGVVPQSLARTFLTGVPRTGYVACTRPLLAPAGEILTGRWLPLLREGHLDKLLVFTLPLFIVKKATKKVAQFEIALHVAGYTGVSPKDMSSFVERKASDLLVAEPAKTLIRFDEERMMSFLAKICMDFDEAIAKNPELKKLGESQIEYIKAVIMMDFWLGVAKQVESIYADSRGRLRREESQLQELKDRVWMENWRRRLAEKS